MEVLESYTYYNKFGTRRTRVKFQGDYTDEELVEKLVTDAPYGHHIKFDCIDKENKIYKGEVSEYWD
jgi:hypothetical protein